MFDFDAGKFLIIGVVALIVIGPKELPRVLRQVGQMVGRVRRMATEFQGQFMDAMKEADIDSIREELKALGDEAELKVAFDPARDIQRELTSSFEASTSGEMLAAEAPAAAIAGFALPPPPESTDAVMGEGADTMAAAGIAPVTEEIVDDVPHDALQQQSGLLPNGKKRKIIMPKRRAASVSRVHAVFDRTATARARTVHPRPTEAVHR